MKSSELPLRPDGSIYHLGMQPGRASHRCLLVGDPGRVSLAISLLDSIQYQGSNREFVWVTGNYKGVSVSIIGTGIGGDNTEIAVVELDALHNIDLSRGKPFPTHKRLYFLRIGTCGLIQPEVSLGTAVFSIYGVGIDPLPHFYEAKGVSSLEEALQHHWDTHGSSELRWYAMKASPFFEELSHTLQSSEIPWVRGITYSALGFYAPQGRQIRTNIRYPNLAEWLGSFSYQDYKIQNIEMEVAPLYAIAQALGHEAGAICLGIAHRHRGEFAYKDGGISPEEGMKHLLLLGLDWLSHAP
ncbi:MAG: phosphorylase [Bacteroidia bacterium]|nr:phosphorylase [Bacteroidia bacterium]MDW8133972.1 phosphorylase [Bacteroidia bacterium]